MLGHFKLKGQKMTNHQEYNPYQAPQHYEAVDDDYGEEYEYAGFWIRVLAAIIDSLVIGLVIVPIFVVVAMMGFVDVEDTSFGIADVVMQVLSVVFYVFCWVKYAGTPGKRILKLKVLDADTGENLTVGKAIIRYIVYIISYIPLFLGLIWVAFDKRKQGWHDKAANSVVVKEL